MSITAGIPKNKCGVYVNSNVYGTKAPYDECEIICEPNKPHPLQERVFTGTLEECKAFVKKNCKNLKKKNA